MGRRPFRKFARQSGPAGKRRAGAEDSSVPDRTSHLTSSESFRIARGLRVVMAIGCPLLAAGQLGIAWKLWQDRLAGRGWDNDLLFGLMLATLAGLVVLFVAGLVLVWRARIDLRDDGFDLRGLLRTRTIPWTKVEGYRWMNGQMNAYLADDQWAWFAARVPDLNAVELAREASEIRANLELGLTDEERAARLAGLRRVVLVISVIGYAAAAVGGANAFFLHREDVQLAAAAVLAAVPPLLVLLALQFRNLVRIGPVRGSAYPDALPGILAASVALGLIALVDPHTLLGDGHLRWSVPLAVLLAGLWLIAERDRLQAPGRAWTVALLVVASGLLSFSWAGGGVYLINTGADASKPQWATTRVTARSTSTTKAGRLYHVTVAPWSASRDPVKLDVPRRIYQALRVGSRVRIGVRQGALGIPWVAGLVPARDRR